MRLPSRPILCACIACLFFAGCRKEETAAPPAVRPARVAVVTPHKLELVAQGAGRIEARYVARSASKSAAGSSRATPTSALS